MAVCCGQSPWIHSNLSLLLPQSCADVYSTSLPPPSGARGTSVSLLALTVVLALTCSTGGEGMYTRVGTLCAVCVSIHLYKVSLLYTSHSVYALLAQGHNIVHTCMRCFISFPPTSPSRVTTWWEATSCRE